MKYHQTHQKETAIYLPTPWERWEGDKSSEAITPPVLELTLDQACEVSVWGKNHKDPELTTHFNLFKASANMFFIQSTVL